MSHTRRKRRPPEIEVVWTSEPSDEAIYRAQLRLLGWRDDEIKRAVERRREEERQAGQQPPGGSGEKKGGRE